jgi:hypothetical protein
MGFDTATDVPQPGRRCGSRSTRICFFIGGIETLGLLPQEIPGLSQKNGFPPGFVHNFDINEAGFIIIGLFVGRLGGGVSGLALWRRRREVERTSKHRARAPAGQRRSVRRMSFMSSTRCRSSVGLVWNSGTRCR